MLRKEQLVSQNTAELAKKCGFDWEVLNFYHSGKKPYLSTGLEYQSDRDVFSNWNNGQGSYPTKAEDVLCSAPSQSLLQKWLREVKNENIIPPLYFGRKENAYYACFIIGFIDTKYFKTYEEALENELYKCLQKIHKHVYKTIC